MICVTDLLGAGRGPNFRVEPSFMVSAFLAWLTPYIYSQALNAQKRVFGDTSVHGPF